MLLEAGQLLADFPEGPVRIPDRTVRIGRNGVQLTYKCNVMARVGCAETEAEDSEFVHQEVGVRRIVNFGVGPEWHHWKEDSLRLFKVALKASACEKM